MIRPSGLRLLLAAVLALSLVANFFLAGYALNDRGRAQAGGILAEGALAAYPEPVRQEFRRILRDNRLRTFAALRDMREARRSLAEAVNARPFDEAAVTRAMAAVRSATDGLQRLMQEFLLQALRETRADRLPS
ncbi:heavy-metal resistance protein [Stella humosa]|uniref:Heavy-metal resistance protein n=1 Tax=Stella humosa TaxID=94 RepID=A0A3N1MF43_9PROT|nr:periplasmic heavy metal sensor [Stella humosa]ROP99805.1 heavy-metal resistance protein [Stella humosa]BBK30967.1 hypothetical protein STHU_16010 [Stella humosa]